jgi:adenylate cyclase
VHCWAERYDRKLEDIFAVQDEVVGTIAGILAAHVRRAETERTRSKPPSGWQAYDYYLRGVDYYNGSFSLSLSAEDLAEARRLFLQSLAIDPDYARSHAMLATSYCAAWVNPVDSDFLTPDAIDRAEQLARKAIQLDPNLSFARAVLAIVLVWRRDYETCMNQIDRAVALNPNNPDWRLGMVLTIAGHAKRAIDLLEACRRLDPFHHLLTGGHLGFAHYMLGQYAQALPFLRDFTAQAPKFLHGHIWLAATLARLGLREEARAEVEEVRRLRPQYASARSLRQIFSFRDAKDEAHFLDALRLAGLPE